jgi:hypothetical protein
MPKFKLRKIDGDLQIGVLARREAPCEGYGCIQHFVSNIEEYGGMAVKLLCNAPNRTLRDILPKGYKYRVLYMLRDPEEISRSYESFFQRSALPIMDPKNYYAHMDYVWRKSPGNKTKVRFEHVVEDPLGWFKFMKAIGWPIDPEAAASVVNKKEYHHKTEDWGKKQNISLGG